MPKKQLLITSENEQQLLAFCNVTLEFETLANLMVKTITDAENGIGYIDPRFRSAIDKFGYSAQEFATTIRLISDDLNLTETPLKDICTIILSNLTEDGDGRYGVDGKPITLSINNPIYDFGDIYELKNSSHAQLKVIRKLPIDSSYIYEFRIITDNPSIFLEKNHLLAGTELVKK